MIKVGRTGNAKSQKATDDLGRSEAALVPGTGARVLVGQDWGLRITTNRRRLQPLEVMQPTTVGATVGEEEYVVSLPLGGTPIEQRGKNNATAG